MDIKGLNVAHQRRLDKMEEMISDIDQLKISKRAGHGAHRAIKVGGRRIEVPSWLRQITRPYLKKQLKQKSPAGESLLSKHKALNSVPSSVKKQIQTKQGIVANTATPALGRLRKENHKFQPSLGYTVTRLQLLKKKIPN
jgi:hypothetical protein